MRNAGMMEMPFVREKECFVRRSEPTFPFQDLACHWRPEGVTPAAFEDKAAANCEASTPEIRHSERVDGEIVVDLAEGLVIESCLNEARATSQSFRHRAALGQAVAVLCIVFDEPELSLAPWRPLVDSNSKFALHATVL